VEQQVVARLRSLLTEVLAEGDLVRLPTRERCGDVVGEGLELARQGKSVGGRFGGTGGGMRPWDGGGVSASLFSI
jgi:hypothetical protein